MIDHDVLQSTLDHALRNGGDFAEVFVEDRRSSSGRFDDGRVEELVSGRDRGAGLRVVRGDTTGFAHTADLSPAGLLRAAEAAAAAARGGGGGDARSSLEAGSAASRPTRSIVLPETVEKRRKVELLAPRRRRRPRARASAVTSVTASYADARRRIQVANSDGLLAERRPGAHADDGAVRRDRRHRHADRATKRPAARWGSSSSTSSTPEDVGRGRRAARADAARRGARAVGHDPGRAEARRGRRAVPRSVRSRARGRPHPQGRVGVHRIRSASRSRRRSSRSSTTAPTAASGARSRIDDEGHPAQRNVLIENGVLTDYMWDVAARPQGGPRDRAATAGARPTATCRCRA